jgi:hypothetical protein
MPQTFALKYSVLKVVKVVQVVDESQADSLQSLKLYMSQ